MVLLILESLGSTELLFILVMALVFFGPRKLPQLSRSLGKSMAEFRKASEDFKRTWEKEVNLEEPGAGGTLNNYTLLPTESSATDDEKRNFPLQAPTIEAVTPERVIARQISPDELPPHDQVGKLAAADDETGVTKEAKSSAKHDWL